MTTTNLANLQKTTETSELDFRDTTQLMLASEKNGYLRLLLELIEMKHFTSVIDCCYTLEQIAEAHRYVETGHKKGNVVIAITPYDSQMTEH